ncbi:hypothetical protein C5D98_14895 [Rathayibacter rathayi]|uniref:hypothetical protein n=1 Tax=Rathayibacter rathayi TaxID=33887 RepID=UPI000CE780E5|nr:hypothetical protein [Rathayibacter rathayi]PPG77469.1 hypothetical protein C5C15_09240 [Rathayibacter rathayi]PPI65237.1 hypothetical protein C5D98_14895 [Rathayibacter rathayi]
MNWTRNRDDDGYVFYTATTNRGTYRIETRGIPSWRFTLTRPSGDTYITKTLTDAKAEAEVSER